jgi:hypothetical protein
MRLPAGRGPISLDDCDVRPAARGYLAVRCHRIPDSGAGRVRLVDIASFRLSA